METGGKGKTFFHMEKKFFPSPGSVCSYLKTGQDQFGGVGVVVVNGVS